MTQEIIQEDKIEEEIEKSKIDVASGKELIEKKKQADKANKPVIHNEGDRVSLGELGSHDCVSQEDIDEVFDKLNEIIFKMKKCMFRISYVNKGQRKFTCELINEKLTEKKN